MEVGRYGEVLVLDAKVLSPNGLTVVRNQADWDDIEAPDSDGLKTLSLPLPLPLPAPNSLSYEANLVPDPEELDNPFAEHTLTVAYQLKVPDSPKSNDPPRTVERNYAIDGTGTAYIDFEYYGRFANARLAEARSLVTASYMDAEMAALDEEVRKAGLLFLNEMGVDPGLDHMAAVRMIAAVHERGGAVVEFHSSCGGLPAPAHNTNPFGYKFSWSPEGMLMAAREGGRYLRDGEEVDVPPEELFHRYGLTEIPGVGVFEVHVNRDALPYQVRYGIPEAKGIFRGTLRNVGHCETFGYLRELRLLDGETPLPKPAGDSNPTVRETLASWLGLPVETLEDGIAARLNVPLHALVLKKLEWLGMLDDRWPALPAKTPLELLAARMKERLVYAPGETDLLVQHHGLTVEYPDGRRERWTAVLSEIGDPQGHSAMARTVGLPAAIGARLILEEKIKLTGVRTPFHPEIYGPVLSELEAMGVRFQEAVVLEEETPPLVWP